MGLRATWTGAITFGLVNVPAKIYKAVDDLTVKFHQLHAGCGERISVQKVCTACGCKLEAADIAKGYDYGSGEHIVLPESDLDRAGGPNRVIEILHFTPAGQAPAFVESSYYVGPGAHHGASKQDRRPAPKPFMLLREAMGERVAVCRVRLRDRDQLALLRGHGDVLMLDHLPWPDEVRTPDLDYLDTFADIQLTDAEARMGRQLVEAMVAPFDPDAHHDTYRERLHAIIDARLEGRLVDLPAPAETTYLGDLMAALNASVAAVGKAS